MNLIDLAPLKPLQKAWMALAGVLGFIVSHIILTVLFYCVFTPIGLIARIFRADLLDKRLDSRAATYWKPHLAAKSGRSSYEN